MGKRKKSGKLWEGVKKKGSKSAAEDEDTLVDPGSRGYVFDEVDEFHEERDAASLKILKRGQKSDNSNEQVLGLGSGDTSSSENEEVDGDVDSDDSLLPDDDIIDTKDDDANLPDERSWGQKKRFYFGTDYSDERLEPDSFVRDGEDDSAIREEETAKRLQERLADQVRDLQHQDLLLFPTPDEDKKKKKGKLKKEKIDLDVDRLSKSKRLALLKSESPVFFPVIEDAKEKCAELKDLISPLLKFVDSGRLPKPICLYVKTIARLYLHYLSCVGVYMLVRCGKGGNVSEHPVLRRMAQYRSLIGQLEDCNEVLRPQLVQAVEMLKQGEDLLPAEEEELTESAGGKKRKRQKTLAVLGGAKNNNKKKRKEDEDVSQLFEDSDDEDLPPKQQTPSVPAGIQSDNDSEDDDADIDENNEEDPNETGDLGDDERRGISYKIKKNKGLMPCRRKDQRNPRVKYRNKYKDKLKRRKGQVRTVRKEEQRYAGELSGIKKGTVKSIKIK